MRLLCRLGLHRHQGIHTTGGGAHFPSVTIVDRHCTRPGCDHIATELWWKGRKL